METFYVLALCKWCTTRYYSDRVTMRRLVIDSVAYVRRKQKRVSGKAISAAELIEFGQVHPRVP